MKLDVKLIQKEKNKLKLLISGVTPQFANAIRRTIMNSVPTMAMENLEVTQNSSVLYDEMLGLRLGLVPLKTDLKSYNFVKDCTCKGKGCAKCTATLSLKIKGPKTVLASDMIPSDPKIKPVYPETIINFLQKGQEIILNAKAVLGTGSEHAKWNPGTASYRYYPIIKIDQKKAKACKTKNCVKACPKNILQSTKTGITVDKKKLLDCDLCLSCMEACDCNALIVEGDDTKFIFEIESWGQLPVKEILLKAKEILKKEFSELQSSIK